MIVIAEKTFHDIPRKPGLQELFLPSLASFFSHSDLTLQVNTKNPPFQQQKKENVKTPDTPFHILSKSPPSKYPSHQSAQSHSRP